MKLDDLDFGELSAESDEQLERYFVVTSDVDQIVAARAALILGRKGSGKTSLFRQLEAVFAERGQGTVRVVRITPDAYAWESLRAFSSLGLPAEAANTSAWALTLLVQAAVDVCSADTRGWEKGAQEDVEVLRRFIEQNFGSAKPGLASATRRLSQISTLNFSALGAGFGIGLKSADASVTTPALVQELMELLVRPAAHGRWLLALDQLDEVWDGAEATQALLVGLIKASKAINDGLGWRDGRGIRVIAMLRSDIYEVLDYDDRDKHRGEEMQLSWTSEDLADMIQRRLPTGMQLEDLFESPSRQAGGRLPLGSFAYVVRQTFRRPREVIQFLITCQKAAPEQERINESLVRRVTPTYSDVKLKDLKQEYRKSNPWLSGILEALRGGPNKYDDSASLSQRLEERAPGEVAMAGGARSAIDFLFQNSVLGTVQRLGGGTKYKAESPELGLVPEWPLWVHPSLTRALDLLEPRPDTAGEAAP